MIEACRIAGVPLFTAYYRRALPRFLEIKKLLADGSIGDVRAVNIALYRNYQPPAGPLPWRVEPAIAGGGLFVDLASHTLDSLDYLLGPIARVSGGAANQGGLYAAEDIVSASLQFGSGARGVGLWAFSASGDVDRTEIVGSRGRISFATFDEQPVVLETGAGARSFTIPSPAARAPAARSDDCRRLERCRHVPQHGETWPRARAASWTILLRTYYGSS